MCPEGRLEGTLDAAQSEGWSLTRMGFNLKQRWDEGSAWPQDSHSVLKILEF